MSHHRKHTILFAEDDPPVRKLISTVLTENGFEVLDAAGGKEAIEIYKTAGDKREGRSIDAIISDLRMPNVSGEEFAKFNYENDNLPFIACTAYSDAKLALSLLKFGIQDYVVKPIKAKHFIKVIDNVISRAIDRLLKVETNRYAGNVESIEIPTRKNHIYLSLDWIREQIEGSFSQQEKNKFLNFISEFLLNAYEHGNLNIGEEEKSQFIETGTFESELKSREEGNDKKITVAASVLGDEIAVNIKDEGDGFDYEKYLKMTQDELLERLEMPNGRGIYMSTNYFDSIEYSDGGTSVQLVKSIN
jgi:CheY-like chemotaxis protein